MIGVTFLGKLIWNPCGETVVSAEEPLVVEMLEEVPVEESTLEKDSEPDEETTPPPRTGVVVIGSYINEKNRYKFLLYKNRPKVSIPVWIQHRSSQNWQPESWACSSWRSLPDFPQAG